MSRAVRKKSAFVAVDGIDAAAVQAAARAVLGPSARGGISRWDASGVFQDLEVADEAAGAPSARTLLLLYAADLAFRLRWQIRPALAEGKTVVAAPYVDTAVAFGRAAGLKAGWLENLFTFAPKASDRRYVHPSEARATAVKDGFVGFSCHLMAGAAKGRRRRRLAAETAARLREISKRHKAPARKS